MEGGTPHCPYARGPDPRHPACTHSIPHRCRTSLARLVELMGIAVGVVPSVRRAAPLCCLFQVVWAPGVEVLCYRVRVAPMLNLHCVLSSAWGICSLARQDPKSTESSRAFPPWAGSAGEPSLHGHGYAAGLKPAADVSARGRMQCSAACCASLVVPVFLSITAQKCSPKGERRAGVRVS